MRNTSYDKQLRINEILMNLDLTYLSSKTLAVPMQAWVRISTACDLTCPLCERQHVKPVDSGFMDFDSFEKLAGSSRGMQKAHLFGLGEPFLNKRFFEYVDRCHAQGILVSTTSHAMHIDEALARKIIESGMEELAISMDAAEPELFNRLRRGSDFDTVCKNVRQLCNLKKEMGSTTPQMMVCCTVSKENVHQLESLVELAARLGVQRISFSDITAFAPQFVGHNISGTDLLKQHLDLARSKAKKVGLEVEYFQQNAGSWEVPEPVRDGAPRGCAMAWTNLVVERRGETKFCCYIPDPLPSAFEQPALEVFNSKGHCQNRQALIDGVIRKECRECPNLFENSSEWVDSQLNLAHQQIEGFPELAEEDRQQLHTRLQEYRKLADARFGTVKENNKRGWRHRLRSLLGLKD